MHPLLQTIFIRRRREEERRKKLRPNRFLTGLGRTAILLISITFILGVMASGYAFTRITRDLPSLDQIQLLLNEDTGLFLQPTRIYDRSGTQLLAVLENPGVERRYMKLDPDAKTHFSPQLIRIMVDSLQPDFWSSPGFSITEWNNPQPVTIAERLVDALLLEKEPESLQRSIRMRLLAGQLVAKYGRIQVLEWFLNSAYFGHLTYNADSAAQLYLGKSSQDLNLPEAILLTSVYMAPALNPMDTPTTAREYQQVLAENLTLNGYLSESEFSEVLTNPVQFASSPTEATFSAFTTQVIDQAADTLGKQTIERGGLIILSTLDADIQKDAECVLLLQLNRIKLSDEDVNDGLNFTCDAGKFLAGLPLTQLVQPLNAVGSVTILDNRNGEILALIGDMDSEGIETTLKIHQAGSLLTPVAAVAAFSRGINPATLLWDLPPSTSGSGGELDYSLYQGPMRLRIALVNDHTAPLVNLVERIGAATVWRSTEPLGLASFNKADHDAQVIYGEDSLSILDAAHIYSVFANLGIKEGYLNQKNSQIEPAAIRQITTTSGEVLYSSESQTSQAVLSEPIAYLVHDVLSNEPSRWSRYGHPNLMEIGKPAGVKVGVTSTGDEVWTAGYTRQYTVVSWVGKNDNSMLEGTLDYRIAAGIWNALIQQVSLNEEPSIWEMPSGVTRVDVCDPSGNLATSICPVVVSEVFLTGMEPASYDSMYQEIEVNRETGRLATIFTPLELIERQVFFIVPDEARDWAAATGIAQPPVYYDTIQVPATDPDMQISFPSMFASIQGEITVTGSANGDDFQSYSLQVGEGLNPATWQEIGSGTKPIIDGVLGTWNSSTDGLYAIRLVIVHKDQQITSTVIQVSVDNTSPSVKILYPSEGGQISVDNQPALFFQIEVTENVQVQSISWLIDGKQIDRTENEIRNISWKPVAGSHTLTVEVTDTAGNTGSASSVFSVTN